MSSTYLERTRSLNEKLERLEAEIDGLVWDLPKNPRENVERSLLVSKYLQDLQLTANNLADIYEDKDG